MKRLQGKGLKRRTGNAGRSCGEHALCETSLCETALCETALCETSLCERTLCETALCEPTLDEIALCENSLCENALCENTLCESTLCENALCEDALCDMASFGKAQCEGNIGGVNFSNTLPGDHFLCTETMGESTYGQGNLDVEEASVKNSYHKRQAAHFKCNRGHVSPQTSRHSFLHCSYPTFKRRAGLTAQIGNNFHMKASQDPTATPISLRHQNVHNGHAAKKTVNPPTSISKKHSTRRGQRNRETRWIRLKNWTDTRRYNRQRWRMLKQSGSKALWDLVATLEPGLATPEPNLLTKTTENHKFEDHGDNN